MAEIVQWIVSCRRNSYHQFEQDVLGKVFELGRLFVALFLCVRQEQWAQGDARESGVKSQGLKDRLFGTVFGNVRYWRTYLYRSKGGGGYYPLDIELGLPQDSFSMLVRSLATRLATKMSYGQSAAVFSLFLRWSPCAKTMEEMVLGLGRHTENWFSEAPVPEDDGDVLIVQIDSKATPTATEEELEKRRGKRPANPHRGSQRHRRRDARKRRGSKKRRKKGDKSKNGKMATIVVLYTLRRSADGTLEGPIRKKVYASYAPKRHAVAIARREADKRGFGRECPKRVQIVTDGDNDLARYVEEFFPDALHTLDVFHAIEYLWEAGGCLFKEGSDERVEWVEAQKEALYEGRASDVIEEINRQLGLLPRKGPGMKKRRERLASVRDYLAKRVDKMNYKFLREQDLEISSGAVEGAVKYVIANRFDSGGMRWIKERAEALLQLRCIEVNGDWDHFISSVHDKTRMQAQEEKNNYTLKSKEPAPLPTYGLVYDTV